MSGHSHFSTIKRQKESKDAAKGRVFSRMAMMIQIAVKTGGGGDPDGNSKLRVAIDQARAVNMPKANIERAIAAAKERSSNLEEVTYEGFGPLGVSVVVEAATDNRNRTSQEIKNVFEKAGGSMGGPGSVMFNFEAKGLIVVNKDSGGMSMDDLSLKLIDLGVDDIEEADDMVHAYVAPDMLFQIKVEAEKAGIKVESFELVKRPVNYQLVEDPSQASKILTFLENLEDHDDVTKVFANVDIPQETLSKISS